MCPVRRILIIGGSKKLLRSAVKANVEVLSIQKNEQFKTDFFEYASKTFLVDYEDIDALIPLAKGIYEAYPFQYVLSMTETGLLPAAAINDSLGLPGNSVASVKLLRDKVAMREFLKREGISPVESSAGVSKEDISEFGAKVGWPIIVKPRDGSGSYGIFKIDSLTKLDDSWSLIRQLGLEAFIMEEFLDGPEISVEAFSFNGRHVIAGMTDKWTLSNFVEIGHSVPSQIECTSRDEVEALVERFLTAVGIQEGPTHTELRLTQKGPRIIESHNRVGGDKIHDLVELAYGLDMVELACSQPFDPVDPSVIPDKPSRAAAIRFFTPDAGVVTDILGLEEARQLEYVDEVAVTVKAGDAVPVIKHSLDRVGYVVTVAEDAAEAVRLSREVERSVQIITELKAGEPMK
ncbi:ATP-grasp domain-containing protein [Paenibacillus sp. S150]|uniref:ATP-grasp domain-containing protein n=1 Tax=Paenibacillus sp. S150 TaxID=2749826 RepID=UPI001C59C350|nr:ATP-grasp domain-containing protein [Paenibacillus sp. S150]MBW4082415.1 ATP-grasp domain-containing protein [Paenibacillus sp. S150]